MYREPIYTAVTERDGNDAKTSRLSGAVEVAEEMLAPVLLMVGAAFLFRDRRWWISGVWLIAFSAVLGNAIVEKYDLPSAVSMVPLGAGLAWFSVYYAVRMEAALRLAPVAVFGAWMVLDGVQAYRHGNGGEGTETSYLDEISFRESRRLFRTMSHVTNSLHDEPADVSDLSDRLDIERSRVAIAISELETAGQIRYEDGRYHAETGVSDGMGGLPKQAVRLIRWVLRRLVRPAYPERY